MLVSKQPLGQVGALDDRDRGKGKKQGLKDCSWLPSRFSPGLCAGPAPAACPCCPDTWIKKERGVSKWYILLTYPIHFLLKPKPGPSAASRAHTVKLFHSAGRHFVNISQAGEIWTKASFIRPCFKQKLRSCGENKERSVVSVSGKSEVDLQGESDSVAETLNIKWAIWFGQRDALQGDGWSQRLGGWGDPLLPNRAVTSALQDCSL